MRRNILLALMLVLGCASDPNGSDANPYAGRTYSRVSPCPPAPAGEIGLCDRGDGQTPRFVSEDACAQEVGGTTSLGLFFSSTHPQRMECLTAARVGLSTIADFWRAVHATR